MCNAHNHAPGCNCGWGGTSYAEQDEKENTFNSMFGRISHPLRKRKKTYEELTCSKSSFNRLFDNDNEKETRITQNERNTDTKN